MTTELIIENRKGTTVVSAYLLLRQNNDVCLLLRKNTGYNDGYYGLIAGHVEDGETATQGMIREAYEEAGLTLIASELKVVHITHRKENRLGIDIFFECLSWSGSIENKEPYKCEQLAFFPKNKLPQNTIPYIANAIHAVDRGQFYSEYGWASTFSR